MNQKQLIAHWKAEENIAHIQGWDFSHIEGRYTEQDDLPWDYRAVIGEYLRPEMKILDIDTGGGEFLLSLKHPHENTAAMENYPPNVQLCKAVLLPLGIDFRPGSGKGKLPFPDDSFDMVINRHGDFHLSNPNGLSVLGGLFGIDRSFSQRFGFGFGVQPAVFDQHGLERVKEFGMFAGNAAVPVDRQRTDHESVCGDAHVLGADFNMLGNRLDHFLAVFRMGVQVHG